MRKLILLLTAGLLHAQDAANGKRLFSSVGCYECHGRVGQGGSAGPRLAPRPVPLEALVAYVRHPSGAMPPYTAKLVTDAQLADIHAYLASIPSPAKDIPLLKQQ
jgi:ubiquinol-cytochrome c reductase cytochrome c subunit